MAKSNAIVARLERVREWMKREGITTFVVPTCDPHNSEYVPAHWQCREWLTGFTGSAGTAVVTPTKAVLWTDSRYWIQAAQQLEGTPFTLLRDESLLPQSSAPGVCVYDPRQLPDPFDAWWEDRPGFPLSQAWVMPDSLAGESAQSKLERLQQWLRQTGREDMLVEELAEVMWLLNLRGDDIPYNPFLISFLTVRASGPHTLYIYKEQISPEVEQYLGSLSVKLAPYGSTMTAQPAADSPIAEWRNLKNATEQAGFRRAHELDGVALVRFLRSLAESDVSTLTEVSVDERLTALRAENPEFLALSFGTIAAYGPHGAIVHYEAEPDTAARLEPHGLLLLDSGAHYRCGTTDVTRTIALGPLTPEERRVYTLVLKGHLQLQHMRFPDGTLGLQLDTAARMPLWQAGLDFGHGTGHGVGHVLGVHEGPHQIRKNRRDCTLMPFHAGQTMTDEPGIYLEGRFGVRIENVLLSRPVCTTTPPACEGEWLEWEILTLCPYDLEAIDLTLLTPDELRWLNQYHAEVCRRLLPLLPTEADRLWLQHATRPVSL